MTESILFPFYRSQGDFYCEPLSSKHKRLVKTFQTSHPEGKNVAGYLKKKALEDQGAGLNRTFLVFDNEDGYLCGFFSLKAGLFPIEAKGKLFHSLPGIDLVYFAKNKNFVSLVPKIDIGSIIFFDFVLPLVKEAKKFVGASYLYIYAIASSRLQDNYRNKYGFSIPPKKVKEFVESHIKPDYDENCDFMFIHLTDNGKGTTTKVRKPNKTRRK